jgi:3',5'-cyclic AMP phosphodiesterase CpdA
MLEAAVDSLANDPTIDHVVVTGDLTNLALESEMTAARAILAPLSGKLSVIPGNHDVYTRGAERTRRFEQIFGDWMFGASAPVYPWHKRLAATSPTGPALHLLGFCSAVARPWFIATGVVSRAQLDRLQAVAQSPDFADPSAFRVALVHHNLHARGWRKDAMHGLTNRDELLDALREAGVGLLLHGHTHFAHRKTLRGVEVVGCGSTTWSSSNPDHLGRYNVYTFAKQSDMAVLAQTDIVRFDADARRFIVSSAPAA